MKAVTEEELVAKAVAPRVTKEALEANIKEATYFYHGLLTICVIELMNGFTVVGESACASPENYDKDVGERLSYGDAKNKIWALMGYELKSKVALARSTVFKGTLIKGKTYVGTKVLQAVPLNLGNYNQARGWSIPVNEDPAREGYMVLYPDDYTSWSPKEVFEEAYIHIPAEEATEAASPSGVSEANETWEDRLRKEADENALRLSKLKEFLDGPLYAALPDRDQRLLREQADAMTTLDNILVSRLVGIS